LRPARERRIARARAEMAFSCEMTRFVEFLLPREQLLGFFFLDAGDGNAGPAADDIFDVLAADYSLPPSHRGVVLSRRPRRGFALLALFVGVEAGLLELVVGDGPSPCDGR